MHIVCPHCRNPIEVVKLTPRQEIPCPSCGSSFCLETGSTTGWELTAGQTVGKFELLDTVGSGAFGTVYKARDPELDRTVALKVPRAGNLPGPQELDRFLREARSAAQLRHPSIVSVHEVGQAGGVPYLVSDFVEGVTLADLLSARRPAFRESADLVAAVADALQYAHEHGVVHRDVKPSNVMVGEDGRPHVMDFGLAKREAGEVTMTVEGQVLGTPAYMSPEQARGEAHRVDGRSDLYSLGVILYRMLTGELPFRGTQRMLLHQVVHDDPKPPRRLNDRVPRDLETVCLKCLHKEPARRYATAAALADDLRRFLKGEPILARPAGAWERGLKWVRRRPAVAGLVALGVVTLVTMAMLLVGLLYGVRLEAALGDAERQRGLAVAAREEADRAKAQVERQKAEAALAKVRDLLPQARWAEARAVLEQTRDHLGDAGPADLRQRVEQAMAGLALVDRLEGIRMRRATVLEGKFDTSGAEREYAAAFRDAGLAEEGDDPVTVAARLRASSVGDQLVAALDDWSSLTDDPKRQAWLLEVTRRADPDVWRDRFRDPKVWQDRAKLEGLAEELLANEAQLARAKPQLLAALARRLELTHGRMQPLLAAAQARHPDDFWLNLELGVVCFNARQLDAAVGFCRAAVALRPSAAAAHNNLGSALKATHQLDEAIWEYRKAIDLDPKEAKPHNGLGQALLDKHQLDKAIEECRKAIGLDPKLATAHGDLAIALEAKGQPDEAIKEYRKAIEFDPKLAPAHHNLGNALSGKHQLDAAIAEYRKAIDLDPKDQGAHHGLANALSANHQLDEAIEEYHKAIDLDPKDAPAHQDLGNALFEKHQLDATILEYHKAIDLDPKYALPHNGLASALYAKHQLDAAIAEYHKAIDLDPKFPLLHINLGIVLYAKHQLDEASAEFRKAIDLDPKLASAHQVLGNALMAKGQPDAAIGEFRKAIDLDPKLALVHHVLGDALEAKGQPDAAIGEYRKAIDLDPQKPGAHHSLGLALYATHQLDAAIGEYRKATDLDPKDALPHHDLGTALFEKHQLDAAIAEYHKALDLDPKLALPHHGLGDALAAKGQPDAAIGEYRKAIGLDPKDQGAHHGLANALYANHQLDEAVGEYHKAIDLDPKDALAHSNLGAALAAKGQPDAAIGEYHKAIDLDSKLAPPHQGLGTALENKRELDAAIREYQKAIKLDPKLALAHNSLGAALLQVGRFAEARESYRRCLELLQPDDPSCPFVRQALKQCQDFLALDQKIPALLEGKDKPANDAERLALARVCQLRFKLCYAASCRFYAEAFAQDATLAEDMQTQDRYNAACAAALAGCGKGNDAGGLDEQERARLRHLAVAWLRADLAYWAKQAAGDKPADHALVQQTLLHWQEDSDLAGLRDKDAVAKLPADERGACRKLWADVAEVLQKAQEKPR